MKKNYVYFIYKTTCNITNRYYIGMHKTHRLTDGYVGSGTLLKRSIQKHGKENHTTEIIEYCENEIELAKKEELIVNTELLKDNLCMNLKTGGRGGATMTGRKMSDETKKKIGDAHRGRIISQETRDKISKTLSELDLMTGNQYAKGNKSWVGRKHKKESLVLMRDNHPFVKKVDMYDLNNNYIQSFNSLREAENITKILRKHISRCCRGLALTAGKHIWKFKQ